ncbi:MAG: hypothetical protein COW15_15645 [Shewanella sp. CG12_big_fil_rev_8_21_14_0_65_47_15]|nr:MAG: hypothetical protein COW15_15645 [Shewanella sp. CG12_big_fil_rev_8_21_14_0_65_47_15]
MSYFVWNKIDHAVVRGNANGIYLLSDTLPIRVAGETPYSVLPVLHPSDQLKLLIIVPDNYFRRPLKDRNFSVFCLSGTLPPIDCGL